jgi:ABC-2 type transport system permease protein
MEIQEAIQHYPITIFGRPFILLVTFVLPFAFMSYYPVLALLGRPQEAIHPFLPYATPLVACLMVCIALTVWRSGVNRYQSTGS